MLDRVKRLCAENNTNLSKLEKEMNFGNGSIAKWSRQSPSIDKVYAVAQYFGVSMEYLLTGKEQTTQQGGLSFDERELISLFSVLTEHQQEIVLVELRALAQLQTEKDAHE